MRYFFCLLILLFGFLSLQAKAAEITPLTKLDASTKKMMDGLDHNETLQFEAIRSSHGIIRAVESVEKNIDLATLNCSAQNPDTADAMKARVVQWKEDIDPVLEDARQRLNTMIKLQDFAKPIEARAYLKQVDDAVAYKSRGIDSIPVRSKDDCEKLTDKLDDTQKDLKKLLIENLGLDRQIVKKQD